MRTRRRTAADQHSRQTGATSSGRMGGPNLVRTRFGPLSRNGKPAENVLPMRAEVVRGVVPGYFPRPLRSRCVPPPAILPPQDPSRRIPFPSRRMAMSSQEEELTMWWDIVEDAMNGRIDNLKCPCKERKPIEVESNEHEVMVKCTHCGKFVEAQRPY